MMSRNQRKRSLVVVASALVLSRIGNNAAASASTGSSPSATDRLLSRQCQDDTTYVSPMGFTCSAYSQLTCNGLRHVGFSDDETDELIRRCPSSCRVAAPGCDDSATLPQEQQQRQLHPTQQEAKWSEARSRRNGIVLTSHTSHIVGSPVSDGRRSSIGDAIHSHNDPPSRRSTCQPEWDESCKDNDDFHTHVGFDCAAHANLDCTMFEKIGFTDKQVYEIISNCPCSCRVECGTWSMSPSASPSNSPTISFSPSSSPTDTPTTSPSSSPSTTPSATPSSSPSGSPTAVPSSHPSESLSARPSSSPSTEPTLTHSSVPSASPSSHPSESPSIGPSSSPSLEPTVTHSGVPSALPSADPTVTASSAPSKVPSLSPTSSPSVIPSTSPTSSPSVVPTFSLAPSERPSFLPSSFPTATPSLIPSAMPSLHSSTMPSVTPSATPSITPSSFPSSAPTNAPTPSSVVMETTFTIPLELNNELANNDAVALQEVMKIFLELNQNVGTDSNDTAVTIEVADVHVEDVVPRSTAGNGETVTEDEIDNRIGEDSMIAVEVTPVTSEVAAKLRIVCNVYPYRPYVADPGFQFVPRLLSGFPGDYQPFLDHLARSSSTFMRPDQDPDAQTRSSQPPVSVASAVTASESTATTSSSFWEQILYNKAMFIGIIVGASLLSVMILLSIILIRRRRYNDEFGGGDEVDGEIDERPTMFYDNDGNQVIMASKGQGYKYATSAPTPTNVSWRKHVRENSTRSKKTFSTFSPKGVFPKDTMNETDERQRWEETMQQEQLQEQQRRQHEWEHQQIGGFAANRFGDSNSVQGLVIKTAESDDKKNKGHNVSKATGMPILASMKPLSLGKEDKDAAAMNNKPPATPRRYFRLEGNSNKLATNAPDPPSHQRHESALYQKKKMQGFL